ncbi:hypothetical protein [Ligilactobacillus equi]|uniref:Uncharacterized protein n=1 Tax=Ligilactobacillus equi DSM 15833 = JCM 10991 TaxID=1423740 RepID=A0A0R1TK89_9LACO|nr:hypothetical protein [Ligilactobacillus equi]KRL81791.1 hypothetical protein FC36_GL001384 [Ligilactobacillus equi DSM 15833 = JCM 10991]
MLEIKNKSVKHALDVINGLYGPADTKKKIEALEGVFHAGEDQERKVWQAKIEKFIDKYEGGC